LFQVQPFGGSLLEEGFEFLCSHTRKLTESSPHSTIETERGVLASNPEGEHQYLLQVALYFCQLSW
jgi:hypothetical protein